MDKQKQIEEMGKILLETSCMGSECENCAFIKSVEEAKETCVCLKALYNAGYRKIPEGAVVLTREEYEGKEIVVEMSGGHKLKLRVSKFGEMSKILEEYTRKETAEKFAERLKEVEEALLDMVVQFCQMGKEGYLCHAFMSAEENAFDVLDIEYNEKVYDVYKRFNEKWDRPIDEICKEITEVL